MLNAIFDKLGRLPHKSPTDMGANMAGSCIIDDGRLRRVQQEIIRRYYAARCGFQDLSMKTTYTKLSLMNQAGARNEDRSVIARALKKRKRPGCPQP